MYKKHGKMRIYELFVQSWPSGMLNKKWKMRILVHYLEQQPLGHYKIRHFIALYVIFMVLLVLFEATPP